MTILSPDYAIRSTENLDSPALLVFPALVRENIRTAVRLAGSPERLRPHIKTAKSPALADLLLQAGITRFKCATIAEAEMLAAAGAADVLLAYQPVGPKLTRWRQVVRRFPATRFACLTDHAAAAAAIAATFHSQGMAADVYIDLNTGQHRTGLPVPQATDLVRAILSYPGIRLVGLHAYDGHVRHPDAGQRALDCDAAFEPAYQLYRRLAAEQPLRPLVVGGSPTFPLHARREGPLECSPGTFVYWDHGYGTLCPEIPFRPAALLLTRVISLPAADLVCLDLGHKSVAAENDLSRRVFFPQHPSLVPVSQSEEHLVVSTGNSGHSFRPGDTLLGIPWHICPTVALYERMPAIEEGHAKAYWKNTARDRYLTI
jgi:D-serine deaminase-like pyridoxal phosphate-dependent protein